MHFRVILMNVNMYEINLIFKVHTDNIFQIIINLTLEFVITHQATSISC